MLGAIKVALIFYGDWKEKNDANVEAIEAFVNHIGSSFWWKTTRLYGNGKGQISDDVKVSFTFLDKYSRGKVLRDSDSSLVISNALKAQKQKPDPNTIYAILVSKDVKHFKQTLTFCSSYCGYHYFFNARTTYLKYTVVMDASNCGQCIPTPINKGKSPTDSATIDSIVNTLAHELSETVTDPYFNAWVEGPNENADICAREFLDMKEDKGVLYNNDVGGKRFVLQSNWDIRRNKCVNSV